MVMDTGLADRIRRKGVRVVEVAGWMTRSAGSYDPEGTVNHHTAGSSRGATPSLATVIYGRPDVPGPLAQVLQSREPDGRDIAYVIAAGRSNNAGSGGWRGLSGNRKVGGLEVEHTGTSRVSPVRLEISARINAALAEAPGSPRNAANTCQHFEWTSRKIDFHDLAPWTPHSFRARVAYWIGRTAGPTEEDTFLAALTDHQQKQIYDHIVGDGRLAEVFTETAAHDEGRLREVTIGVRALLGVDVEGEVADAVEPGGDARQHMKTLFIGSFLAALDDPTVRAKLKGLLGPEQPEPA